MRRFAVLLLLAGCAQAPIREVQEVRVPVPVPCVAPADVPKASFPADSELAALDDYRLVLTLAQDRLARAAHIARLEAVLLGCTGGRP